MICENVFCVYQKEDRCLLDEVRLDIQGKCTEYIYVHVDETELKRNKQKILERYAMETVE